MKQIVLWFVIFMTLSEQQVMHEMSQKGQVQVDLLYFKSEKQNRVYVKLDMTTQKHQILRNLELNIDLSQSDHKSNKLDYEFRMVQVNTSTTIDDYLILLEQSNVTNIRYNIHKYTQSINDHKIKSNPIIIIQLNTADQQRDGIDQGTTIITIANRFEQEPYLVNNQNEWFYQLYFDKNYRLEQNLIVKYGQSQSNCIYNNSSIVITTLYNQILRSVINIKQTLFYDNGVNVTTLIRVKRGMKHIIFNSTFDKQQLDGIHNVSLLIQTQKDKRIQNEYDEIQEVRLQIHTNQIVSREIESDNKYTLIIIISVCSLIIIGILSSLLMIRIKAQRQEHKESGRLLRGSEDEIGQILNRV